jgi:hypothetical protein
MCDAAQVMGSCLRRNDGVIMISAPGQDRFGSMPADGAIAAVDNSEQIEYKLPIFSLGLENTGCAFRDSRNFSPPERQSAATRMEIPEDFSRQSVNACVDGPSHPGRVRAVNRAGATARRGTMTRDMA